MHCLQITNTPNYDIFCYNIDSDLYKKMKSSLAK